MPKEVSALNTYWLIQYLQENYGDLDLQQLIDTIAQMFPCYVENLQNGKVEQVSLEHLLNPRYWFSHIFVKALHDLIQEHIPDPRLGFKIGRTIHKTQPVIKAALGIPLLGTHRVAHRVSREAAKYNRTKQYHVQRLGKGRVDIRIIHNPGIIPSDFTMQWNAGCLASYARLAGATNVRASLHCIDSGLETIEESSKAIWDCELRYQEPGVLTRLTKGILKTVPWIKKLTEHAEAIEDEHLEQIFNRDAIIRERTTALAEANKIMRLEIEERRLVEQALLQSKERLQRHITAIDDIGLGLCVIDADYSFRAMNNTFLNWFGDHHGNSCYHAIMGKKSPCSQCKLGEVIEHSRKVRYSPTMADGRTYEIVATPITNSDGTISNMEIIRDITEQKMQEEQRLKTSQHNEQLQKLASLKTMAGAIAHRFNNSMTGVHGNLELLTRSLPEETPVYQMASRALEAAEGASQIGSMMLSYVGQKPLQLEEISFADLFREIIVSLKSNFHPAPALTFVPPRHPLFCSMDPTQIKEVLKSVLTNAYEALGNDTGTIDITFGHDYFTTHDFPLFFRDNNLEGGMYAFCQVKDSGHGMSPENIQQIFEPFFTTRLVGRGLGLALTAGIMQTHRGAITIESRPNIGSTVRVLLPVLSAVTQRTIGFSGKLGYTGAPLSGDILLVDDEPIILITVRMLLEQIGFTVHTVENGREAVNQVEKQDILFCAIVMDILMPEMDGIEAMNKIRKIDATIPILLTSGYSKNDLPFRESRPDAFLAKPVRQSDLQANLEILLAERQ